MSVIGGGKFANGAISGAFSRLFNDEQHGTRRGLRPQVLGSNRLSSEQQAINIRRLLNTATGALSVFAGAGLCATGAGCLVGGPLIISGASNFYTAYDGKTSAFEALSTKFFNNPRLGKSIDFATNFIGTKGVVNGAASIMMSTANFAERSTALKNMFTGGAATYSAVDTLR